MSTIMAKKNTPKRKRQDERLNELERLNNDLKANSITGRDKKKKKQKADDGFAQAEVYERPRAPDRFVGGLKPKNDLKEATRRRAVDAETKQRAARKDTVDSKRKKNNEKTAKVIVEEEVADAVKNGGLDLSDLTYEQIRALKEYGGLTGNMTREQVDEIISRVSPLTEDGTPFIISTPGPKKRFLSPRRLKVKDIVTGKEIIL
jgi:hypothetical protein